MAQLGMGIFGRDLHLGVLGELSRLFGAESFGEYVGNGASEGWGSGGQMSKESPYLIDLRILTETKGTRSEDNLTVIL